MAYSICHRCGCPCTTDETTCRACRAELDHQRVIADVIVALQDRVWLRAFIIGTFFGAGMFGAIKGFGIWLGVW